MSNLSRLFNNPWLAFRFLANRGLADWLPDEPYLKMMYRASTSKRLRLDAPQTFGEKLQWLKMHDRNPLYTLMVDKVKAKEYVAEKIGAQYVIPTLGVWESADDVDFDALPDRFVIKCNHNSGKGMYICRDKAKMDAGKVREGLRRGLKENYYKHRREWPYRDVPRRILAEQYMESAGEAVMDAAAEAKAALVGGLRDYKLFCFNGRPKLCQIISNRAVEEHIDFYDTSWRRMEGLVGLTEGVRNSTCGHPRPRSFDDMLRCAGILAEGLPFARIDFYDIDGRAYWGEIMFFPAGGFGRFSPAEWNGKIGSWLRLPV